MTGKMVTTNARTHGELLFVAVFGDYSVHAKCEQVKTRTHAETFMELGQSRVPTQR